MTRVRLTDEQRLHAEMSAMEAEVNRQPNLPRYVKGENCDICGRGVPRWEFVTLCCGGNVCGCCVTDCCNDITDCCHVPDDGRCYGRQIGRSQGGEIVCSGCGTQVWAPTPQLRHCRNCWPGIWKDMDDNRITIMQLITKLNIRETLDHPIEERENETP